jgi:hypothetical protein
MHRRVRGFREGALASRGAQESSWRDRVWVGKERVEMLRIKGNPS